MRRTFIIAEAGVNHNGSVKTAKDMIDAAVWAGADAAKFQTFKAERMATRQAPMADYQKITTDRHESQFEMLKKLELSREAHKELLSHCREKGIMFLSSPFDIESVDLLETLGMEMFKIPSGEIHNLPFLRKIGGLNKRVILSTGMSDLKDIEAALDILKESGTPRDRVVVLHCTTEYPAPYKSVNLRAMLTMRERFNVVIGYSDHTLGVEVSVAAAALGAIVIEKHFTLDRNMEGPDHKASLEPDELRTMVQAIRNIEKALGDGIKEPSSFELKNRSVARKSIVASKHIEPGETFTEENLAAKRPGTGISPLEWDRILGKKAKRRFVQDDMIEI